MLRYLNLDQQVNQLLAVFLYLRIIPCGNGMTDVGHSACDAIDKLGFKVGLIQRLLCPIQQHCHAVELCALAAV